MIVNNNNLGQGTDTAETNSIRGTGTRGTINGGGNGTDRVNDIEYFTVETLGNA